MTDPKERCLYCGRERARKDGDAAPTVEVWCLSLCVVKEEDDD